MATTPRQVVVSAHGAVPSKSMGVGNKGNKDASTFWNENPRGVPLEALFGNAGGAGEIGARLRTHDISGDGYLDKTEFRNAIMGEISAVKNAKQLKIVAAVLIGLVVVLCAAMTGLTFVVVDYNTLARRPKN